MCLQLPGIPVRFHEFLQVILLLHTYVMLRFDGKIQLLQIDIFLVIILWLLSKIKTNVAIWRKKILIADWIA